MIINSETHDWILYKKYETFEHSFLKKMILLKLSPEVQWDMVKRKKRNVRGRNDVWVQGNCFPAPTACVHILTLRDRMHEICIDSNQKNMLILWRKSGQKLPLRKPNYFLKQSISGWTNNSLGQVMFLSKSS